jgi:hypothetical protein
MMIDESTGAEWRIWPEPEAIAPGTVQETGSYLFELRGSVGADRANLLVDDLPLEALREPAADVARWRWSPGFHAGVAEAELRVPGHVPRRFEVVARRLRRHGARYPQRHICSLLIEQFPQGNRSRCRD